ncbi:MAG TPA: SUMF1/EgtB/PvdO family nonheme iron enzyme [Longimicrobiales bacterium]|nr:SUMF1/EgtB/PvdO family nonheme iron enzyme [Longimicrobiales bacterium]
MVDPISRLRAALADRYEIERELGVGGMATVYLARDLKHGRGVAVKVLKPELAAVVGAERFLVEIDTTANLQHPHILPLFDSGEAGHLLYYVMPYVQGESLRDRLDKKGRLPLDEALALTKDVAAALTYAHAQGVIHRDIKPANVLIEDGEALVADFGIARAASTADRAQLTATGLSLGTPAYMSPEQIGGEETIDGRSDTYALGCLLYEMLVGAPPFTGTTTQAIVAKTLTSPAPSVRDARPDVPKAIDDAIAKALAKRPEDRFESPRDLYDACAAARVASPARRAPRMLTVAAALVAALAGVAMWRALQVSNARALLPEISRLAEAENYEEAYDLAVRAERWIPGDTALVARMITVSDLLTVRSEPEGAQVFVQRFPGDAAQVADSQLIGVAPIVDYRLPRVDHRVVVALAGFPPLERMASSKLSRDEADSPLASAGRDVALAVQFHPVDRVPPEMVAVPGGEYGMVSPDVPLGLSALLDDFVIDRFEVTNEAFQDFVADGGYAKDGHWTDTPEESRSGFVDRTGLPGPRDWVRQDFPDDQARLPVAGVTWYEALAYCRSVGKRLPTVYEWEKTARDGMISHIGVVMPWGLTGSAGLVARRANFSSGGAMPVDAFPFGISPYGAYGMAGNVREWTANALGDGYAVTGGSWEAPSYLYTDFGSQAGTFASPALGFRCARADGPGDQGAGKIELDMRTPVYSPVDEAGFRLLLAHYRYDRRPANPRVTDTVDAPAWTRESLWIDGPGADSVLLYFYAPTNATPPYQTIVYVPGGSVFCCETLREELEWAIGPVIQAGRAVMAVALQGSLDRGVPPGYQPPEPISVRFRDEMVRHATELRLGIDYIETRDDVDPDKLAYVGLSFGAGSRLAFSAVDDRYKAVVYIGGGIDERVKPTLPEADNVNFAPYVSVPKLLVNGRNDEEHPWYTRALPLWNLLSEPKELVLVDGGGHVPPLEERIPAINGFLDRTLGPVAR